MAQLFHRAANTVARLSLLGVVGGGLVLWWSVYQVVTSSYRTEQDVPRDQPVPFSHEHHVTGLGIDCRYCHTSVEDAPFAGVPATEICYGCHRAIWKQAEMLAPVRESIRTGVPLRWTRVHDLPDFVYFDHSIHIARGIDCEPCHGQVGQMPLTWKAAPLTMQWCLDCHRDPARPAPTHCSTCHR